MANTFDLWWPQLETQIAAAVILEEVMSVRRTERDLLEELLLQSRTQTQKLLRETRFVDWLEDFARGLKLPAGNIGMRFGVPAAAATRAEKGLLGTHCPFHDRYLTADTRENDEQGQVIFTATGCCNFVMRLAYESIKDL